MTRPLVDRVKAVWTGTGTGTITLGGAVPGEAVSAFPASLNGQTVPYVIVHETANEAEAGYGLYTHSGTTLSRLYRYYPTPGGSAVAFSAGTKFVSPTVISAHVVPNLATTSPTVNDDITAGFLAGMVWIDSSIPAIYVCRSHADGAASWPRIDGGPGGSVVFADIGGDPSDNAALQAEFDTHTHSVSALTGGSVNELVGFGVEGFGALVGDSIYRNPSQITGPEKISGTEPAVRLMSPLDVKDMATIHGGGGGGGSGGLIAVPNTATSVPVDHDDFGILHDLTAATAVTVTLDANTVVPASPDDIRIVGLRKMGAGTVTVVMESGATYFTAGSNTTGTGVTTSFQVTGYAWAELLRNTGGSSAVWLIGGDTNLPKTVNGSVAFGEAADFNNTVNIGNALVLDGSATFDAGGKLVYGNLLSVVTGVSGLLSVALHLGRMVVTTGPITAPSITGFHCLVEAGGSHTISFNDGVLRVTAAATAGQVCSVVVRSATKVIITPWTSPQTLT